MWRRPQCSPLSVAVTQRSSIRWPQCRDQAAPEEEGATFTGRIIPDANFCFFVYLYVQAPGLVSRRRVQLTTAFRPEAAPSAADGGRGRQPQQHSTTEGGRVRSSGGGSGLVAIRIKLIIDRGGGGGFLHFFARNCFHFSGKRAPQRFSFC